MAMAMAKTGMSMSMNAGAIIDQGAPRKRRFLVYYCSGVHSRPVPLDMNILKALKRSSLGLDWYLWLTYRTFALRAPLRLSWRSLYRQFGANPARAGDKNTVNRFRTECLRELKKIKVSWPELNYATARGVLILSPSKPVIPPHQQRQLVN